MAMEIISGKITGGTYGKGFIDALTRLVRKDIKAVYFGHGGPPTRISHEQRQYDF
jgi:glyoxylase-like metal-dependent hydrolase (beta-lactamase superfamily II)